MRFVLTLLILSFASLVSAQVVKTNKDTLSCGKWIHPYDTSSAKFVITSSSTATVTCVVRGLHFPFSLAGDSVIFLPPLSSDTITALFTPIDVRQGFFTDSLVIVTDFGVPFSHITLSGLNIGYNRGVMNLAPESLDFGTIVIGVIPIGTADTEQVTATNGGKSNLTVSTRMTYSINGGGAFRLVSNVNLKNVDRNEVLPIPVIFQPTNPGIFDDTLLIQSNDTVYPTIRVPLHGRAVPEVGKMSLSATTLGFGTVKVGQSDTLRLTAANTGLTMLTVAASVQTIKPGDPISILINHHTVIVHKDDSLDIPLAFAPTVAGVYYDTVVIETNDTSHSVVRVPVWGVGVPPASVEGLTTNSFTISPSLGSREFVVRLPSAAQAEITVVDLLGRELVRSYTASSENTLRVESLPSGVYFCIVRQNGDYSSERFVIDR